MDPSRKTDEQQMQEQLNFWAARLGVLRARLAKTGAATRIALQKQVDELHELQESAKKHFEQDTKPGLDQKWKALSATVERVWQRINPEETP